ncbi:penicillin-binding transpeptidase domain-containing protein [Acrocarpospora catenulata]|uniref:penicillin-binding transpeptidase domain-containing protein n=1 Tax=Acrocarpospora catenulata TaxID=2836182 RepID=UPI0027E11D2F|nr:penicillin-binding transpeptidase domain-containing protein [Acrocarpospora catenulata]
MLGLLAPGLTACFEEPAPHEAIRDFLVGWQTGDYAMAARRADAEEAGVRKALGDFGLHLDAASIRFKLGQITVDGENAKAAFQAEVDLGENTPLWTYDSVLPLHLVEGRWKVRWSPTVMHPDLHEGQRLAVKADPQGRQPIVDRNGDTLQDADTLYVAQVIPAQLADPARLCQDLAKITGFAQDRLLSRVLSAPPTDAVPLATFGRRKFDEIQAQLNRIEGLKIAIVHPPVAPKSPVQIVGRVTAVTAESEQQLGGPQRAGDTVGRDGLQRAYQDQLTGSTETRVIVLDTKTADTVKELKSWPGRNNTPVQTTLDAGLQQAADNAVNGDLPAALVAVDAPTGQIRAVATKTLHQENDALAGKFPPGTTFSVVATDALLKSGLDVGQKIPCTADRTVGGARFQQTGVISSAPTFEADFAHGCVTALASLARRVDERTLAASAAQFGIGAKWGLPLNSFSGSTPGGTSDAARAKIIAGSIVRVSPLVMALVAGAVQSGTWHPPTLVTSPAAPDPVTDSDPPPSPPDAVPLDAGRAAELRALMRVGVTSGSARAAAAPGDPVYGVASMVSYVEKKERRQLSWFVGWQGDIAVAVMVESADPAAAATIAGSFFSGTQKEF